MTFSSGMSNLLQVPKMMADVMMIAKPIVVTHPMMNFILPALPACTMVGIHWGSRGPNIP